MSIERGVIDPLLPFAALEGRYKAKISPNMPAIKLNILTTSVSCYRQR
jgi:hypothetical protein